jgi:ABC-type multidrug transport system fused ATPase/permease subunit
LDIKTEAEVIEAIDALHGHLTLIIIAHRLSTIQGCDRVCRLGNNEPEEKSLRVGDTLETTAGL